jgi:lipid kinase YegS
MKIECIINTADEPSLTAIRREVVRLREEGHTVGARLTFEGGDAARFAREASEGGADLVISAGGDGTLNEVVNGLFAEDAADAMGRPRLGVIPLGTGNDFAAFMGVPEQVEGAVDLAINGPESLVDVAKVNDRFFLNVSSGGLGAEATEDASDRSKRLLGSIAYLVTGIRKFAALTPMEGRFTSGDEVLFEGPFLFFAVGNGGRTGGGVWITPRANLSDGLLDVCIAGDVDHREFLRMLPDLRTGEHAAHEKVLYRQVSELKVEPVGDLSVNVDGEPIQGSTLDYSIRSRALRVSGTPGRRT